MTIRPLVMHFCFSISGYSVPILVCRLLMIIQSFPNFGKNLSTYRHEMMYLNYQMNRTYRKIKYLITENIV